MPRALLCALAVVWLVLPVDRPAARTQGAGPQTIDLAERLASGKLRAVNREVTPLPERRGAVHVSQKEGNGVVWIEGSEFDAGIIEVNVRGRDVPQQSFVGLAFHRQSDTEYESVYLRPFNFRAAEPDRHQHAVQYVALPGFDWPRLRAQFPEEFENPVDASASPTGWNTLRLAVSGTKVQIFAGAASSLTLEVRRLATHDKGAVGLWVGNNSDGDFADLRLTRASAGH